MIMVFFQNFESGLLTRAAAAIIYLQAMTSLRGERFPEGADHTEIFRYLSDL
jgi:hypothetical protein